MLEFNITTFSHRLSAVSMTTPSASLELGGQSSMGLNNIAVDVRNTSLDSFSEDHIVIGLSTVPNQFCTKRDALELKKLLILSAGTRGMSVIFICVCLVHGCGCVWKCLCA